MSRYAVDTDQRWFNVKLPTRQCTLKELASACPSREDIDEWFQEAQGLLDAETATRKAEQGRWYAQQFLARGTTVDKIASAAVKLSENDFMFFTDSFALLFDTARNDSHHYEAALKALAAVWPRLLPMRPLKRFVAQYFPTLPTKDHPEERKRVLIYWYVEDYLKRTYAQFLSLAEAAMKDKLAVRREAWLDTVGKLLNVVTEGRPVVVSMLVDKMGDPLSSVSHKSYHLILGMLSESSLNQALLQTELERVAFMKGCPPKTIKYCVNVMNQLVFNKDERKLALKCVQTYLSLFRQMVLTDTIDQSVTSAIIVGLRRAFPYSGADFSVLEHHLNSLFILANTGTFIQRVNSMSLLQQLLRGGSIQVQRQHIAAQIGFEDRWYRALYQLLLISPKQLPHSSQLSGFFSLLHKSLRSDRNPERIVAFTHRIVQRCLIHREAFICASLLLVSEVARSNVLVKRLIREHSADVDEYDPKARDPRFAKAQSRCLWTLNTLTRHTHPSVVKIAVLMLLGEEVVFDAHPLDDMTLTNFLSTFVDAKTTKADETTGGNKGVAVFRRTVHVPNNPSTSDAHFASAAPENVDVSALFLHRYAVQRQRFVEGMGSKKHSPWDSGVLEGEADEEEDIEEPGERLKGSHTTALFGPETTVSGKKRGRVEDEVEESDNDEVNSAQSDGFDADFADEDLDWGSDDEHALDDLDDDIESLEDFDNEDEAEGLGGHAEDHGEDFGRLVDGQMEGRSKKKIREDRWMDDKIKGSSGKKVRSVPIKKKGAVTKKGRKAK